MGDISYGEAGYIDELERELKGIVGTPGPGTRVIVVQWVGENRIIGHADVRAETGTDDVQAMARSAAATVITSVEDLARAKRSAELRPPTTFVYYNDRGDESGRWLFHVRSSSKGNWWYRSDSRDWYSDTGDMTDVIHGFIWVSAPCQWTMDHAAAVWAGGLMLAEPPTE